MTIAFFGEVMLRLSPPGRELLLQTPTLEVNVGGAEANVATGLACLGHATRMISAVADNPLGGAVINELRRRGVDTATVAREEGRLGLYFLTPGAGLRASEVVYDRAHSVFATRAADSWDWDRLLEGATRLHLSGITPALGHNTAAAAIAAAEAASARGIPVSFDGNYRAKLWEAWDSDPRAVLTQLISHADILFGNHRDVSLLLGKPFSGEGSDRRREAAEAAFAHFPRLQTIASTARHVDDADSHRVSARVDTRGGAHQTDEVLIAGIVDRIGAGDAFAAGVLHGLIESDDDARAAAKAGLALTALKHSLPGDASLFTRADLAAFEGGGLDVRR
ncbi:2-dehydro-3-deoxygluconokinase [Sphingomonas naasensis]|uniref:Sugar kinase n=1 Tax=Sphingomonas naasensis TaxID=1344951 RepID=A0A4S1WVF7_9SPHN|nr:sugar kinase [Sphingomonas naasensis]NIJ19203.1 2-dehydro-3-deoxygluconokinase [Sphingomonas naasensis]TGX46387.1 sugar kinase [Sphingomonas naasensis]